MMQLHERFRPRTLDDIVGQDKAVETIRRMHALGHLGGHAFFITGKSGTGKTTLANIIAELIADKFFVQEYVGRELSPSVLRGIIETAQLYSFGRGGRAFIINEAHGISRPVIEQLLNWIDNGNVPRHAVVIFTTTRDGQERMFDECDDAAPLMARCIPLALTCQGLASAFAKRLVDKLASIGIEIDHARAVRLVNKYNGNFRAVWQEFETGQW